MTTAKMIGGICLVAGTTIGAGMLALPVVTGLAGFFPTVCLFLLFWAVMTYTAFLILETDLWMKEGSNLITMAKNTLGSFGAAIVWVFYLFLLYCLTTAYLAGSTPIVAHVVFFFFGITLKPIFAALPLIVIFGYVLYRGAGWVDRANRVLMIGLIASYVLLCAFLSQDVNPEYLLHEHWMSLTLAFPLIATSFGYHIIIPTLTAYMHKNVEELKKVIVIGSLIPLVFYIVWEAITLGIVPLELIRDGYLEGVTGTALLGEVLDDGSLQLLAELFSFFAIITSFIGVTLSLSDFLADGLKIKKTHQGKGVLVLMTFLPPLIFIMTNPRAFLAALDIAGVFGVIVLLILFPPLMVWQGRYKKKFDSTYRTPGGKMALAATILFALLAIGLDTYLKVVA